MEMMLSSSCRQDPVLEVKRDGYLAEEKESLDTSFDMFKGSVIKTRNLHANILFTTKTGRLILQDICRLVTYVEPSITSTNWRDLACKLGYSDVEVKCINNLRGQIYDPTEVILQYYAVTNNYGTIGDILEALLELGFLPALQQAQNHIETLLAEIESTKGDLIETPLTEKGSDSKNVWRAVSFKTFLPAIFDPSISKESTFKISKLNRSKENESIWTTKPQTKKQTKQYCKYVLLSFTGDGYSTALRVASVLRATKNKKGLPIGVLMLCENDNQVIENPGQIIPDIISKMDVIIPVLTEGYFSAVKQPNIQAQLLDERYVQFIYDILVSKYIRNSCFNIQVRPVIPNDFINSVTLKVEFIHSFMFNAWKSDDEVSALADGILKFPKNKIIVSDRQAEKVKL